MVQYFEFMCTNFFKFNDEEEVLDVLDKHVDVQFLIEDDRLMLYVHGSCDTGDHLPSRAQSHLNMVLERIIDDLAPFIEKGQTVLCMSMGMVKERYIAGYASAFDQRGWVGTASFDHMLYTAVPKVGGEGVKPNEDKSD